MPRKPPLTLVDPNATGPQPPRPLQKHGMALWNAVQAEYGITDRGGVELLCEACQALDRAEGLAAAIARDGEVVYGKSGPKVHPGLKAEVTCRGFVVRTLTRLGLSVEAIKSPGRQGSFACWTPPE
jgi:hypothetical protein